MCGDGRRGQRGDGSICVVLMRESKTERKWEGESASVYLSHLSLSGSSVFGVIWSSRPVSSRPGTPCSLRVCVLCVYVYVFVKGGGYTVKEGGVKRSPVRVDDADKPFHGRHSCSEIPLRASWLWGTYPCMLAHTHAKMHTQGEAVSCGGEV